MNNRRGPWFILTGLLLGFGLGLGLAWGLPQAQPVDTSPASLRPDFKDDYRYLIAAAYAVQGDLGRAQARLTTLDEVDPVEALGQQAQRMLAQDSPMEQVRILANLSEALQAQPTSQPAAGQPSPLEAASPEVGQSTYTPPPAAGQTDAAQPGPQLTPTASDTPLPTRPPLPTATLRPTHTATATPGAPFALVNQSTACDPQQPGRLKIYLQNASNQPAPGQELVITWFGGENHFFTGFKNEIDPGYADFILTSGVEYALSLPGGARLTGLTAPLCTDADGAPYPGSILLEFRQP